MSLNKRGAKAFGCAMVVLMLGCLAACQQKNVASTPPAPVPTPSETPIVAAPYYTSEVYDFTLELPPDWKPEDFRIKEFMGLPILYTADTEGSDGWLVDICWTSSEEWWNPAGWGGASPAHFLAERDGLVLYALLAPDILGEENRLEQYRDIDDRLDELLGSFTLAEDAVFPTVSYGILTGAEGQTITVDLVEKRPWEELRELPSEKVLYHSYYNEATDETVLPVALGAAVGLNEGAVPMNQVDYESFLSEAEGRLGSVFILYTKDGKAVQFSEMTPAWMLNGETPPSTASLGEQAYAIRIDGVDYAPGADFSAGNLFSEEERTQYEQDSSFPPTCRYEKTGLTANSFIRENGAVSSETLYSLCTTDEGETLTGVKIGSTLAELKTAYPENLVFRDGASGNGNDPVEWDRLYTYYIPDDGTNCSIDFYLQDKKVMMMESADGLDAPRTWRNSNYDEMLGDSALRCERAGDMTRFFTENPDGTEEIVLETKGAVEPHDLDGDGVTELLVWLPGNKRAMGIYDRVDGKIIYLDVNETLGCDYSEYMGLFGNLQKDEYRKCIEADWGPAGRADRREVYFYKDGALTYACTVDEAMG